MESPDTFHQLPLTIDPQTKQVSINPSTSSITTELDLLNALHRSFIKDLDSNTAPHGVPPPPVPVNPKRSAQITKLRETGNASFKKGAFTDAIRFYTLALEMAATRPVWEPSGLVREELSALFGNRAQARIGLQDWAGAAVDAECGVELKKVGNVKGWWRRGHALKEMGRLEEARDWVREAIEFESLGPEKEKLGDLEALQKVVEERLSKVAS